MDSWMETWLLTADHISRQVDPEVLLLDKPLRTLPLPRLTGRLQKPGGDTFTYTNRMQTQRQGGARRRRGGGKGRGEKGEGEGGGMRVTVQGRGGEVESLFLPSN